MVWVDASPVGLAVCLYQRNPENSNQIVLIDCRSRRLSEIEKRYAHIEKEALACVWGCTKMHLYIYGISFELITDNKPVEMILRNPNSKPSARIENLAMKIAPYQFKIIHKPGKDNPADYYSRHPVDPPGDDRLSIKLEHTINHIIANSIPESISNEALSQATNEDEILIKVLKLIIIIVVLAVL